MKKEQEKSQNKSPRTSKEQATPTVSSVQISSSSPQGSPLGRRRSFGKAHTPPEVRRPNLPHRSGGDSEAVKKEQSSNLSDDVVTDALIDGSPVMERKNVKTPNTSDSQVADRKISAPAQLAQNYSARREDESPLSAAAGNVTQERSQTPPPCKNDKPSVLLSTQQNLSMSPLAKSASDPNLSEDAGRKKHETVSKRNSHEDENWYLPGIPRLELFSHKSQYTVL